MMRKCIARQNLLKHFMPFFVVVVVVDVFSFSFFSFFFFFVALRLTRSFGRLYRLK